MRQFLLCVGKILSFSAVKPCIISCFAVSCPTTLIFWAKYVDIYIYIIYIYMYYLYIYIYVYYLYTYGRTMVEIHRFLQLKHEIHHIHHPPQIWRMDFLPPQALHPSQTPSPGRHPNRHLRRDWNTTKGRNLPWKFTMNNWRMHV